MRLVGPHLRPSGGELAQQLARHGVDARRPRRPRRGAAARRSTASGRSSAPATSSSTSRRPPTASGPVPLRVEPGSPAGDHRRRADRRPGHGGGPVRGGAHAAPGGAPTWTRSWRFRRRRRPRCWSASSASSSPITCTPAVREALVEAESARAARLIPRKVQAGRAGRSRSRAPARSTSPRFTPRCATARTPPACWRRRSAGRALRRAGGFRDARSAR